MQLWISEKDIRYREKNEAEEMKNKEQTNTCYGCFGAANGDCDECAKDRRDKDEE